MTSREFRDRLTRRARRADVQLATGIVRPLEEYVRLLARWNEKINLTALPVSQLDDVAVDRLLVEPLVAARYVPQGTTALLDIGSGSGSPAIPLALAIPGVRLRMVESKTRKAVFLTEACRHLGLADAIVETARFEQLLARPELHESADVLTVRAVRVEARTLLTLQAFLRPSGLLLWFRGAGGPDAPANIPPPLRWAATHPLIDAQQSRLVVFSKEISR
jgi:16S rRNA (guanine527-N7)-methyltransferase